MEKVKLTKKQVEFLQDLNSKSLNTDDFIQKLVSSRNEIYGLDLTLEEVVATIHKGWEVEKTPEEKILHFYNGLTPRLIPLGDSAPIEEALRIYYRKGIEDTLKTFNIKVKGIND